MLVTPNLSETMGNTDSKSIQNAIDYAKKQGAGSVTIPRRNARTGADRWDIDETILLPSDITVVLDDCHLRMADGAVCPMFCNANAGTAIGNTAEGVQRNIHIVGKGGATLDGGEPNGLNEVTARLPGNPPAQKNLTIYLHNVEQFSLVGFTVTDQRWWAIALMFARYGRVADLKFRLTRHAIDTYETWRNQDGVDLRIGCHHIVLENMEGEVGDDFIALTALDGVRLEQPGYVEGEARDIHDIEIRNIRAVTNLCAVIRLLNHYGNKIYNVSMENIYDVSRPGVDARSQMVLRIGDDWDGYYRCDVANRAKPGEMYNITAQNIHSRALCAVNTCACVKDLTVRDVYVRDDGGYAYVCGYATLKDPSMLILYHPCRAEEYEAVCMDVRPSPKGTMENILVENVYYEADGTRAPAVVGVWNVQTENVTVRNVHNTSSLPVIHYFDEEPPCVNVE